jgi:hypothetical protein
VTTWDTPRNWHSSSSNAITSGPIPIQPERMTRVTASISASPRLGRPNAKYSRTLCAIAHTRSRRSQRFAHGAPGDIRCGHAQSERPDRENIR